VNSDIAARTVEIGPELDAGRLAANGRRKGYVTKHALSMRHSTLDALDQRMIRQV